MISQRDEELRNPTVKIFEDGDALISAHTRNPFDIILLDVVMPLQNGIEVAKELRESDKNVKIVFLTSSPEYAVDSYTVKASNYLLKPLNSAKLFSCLHELISEIESTSKCLTVKGLDATHRIPLSRIEYVESQSKHNILYTRDNNTVKSTDPLYAYERVLTAEDGFFKCHRSYIVNIHHIDSYSHSEIVMRSGCRIPISRSHRKAFESVYFSVVFEKAGDEI
jgi:DNA-binding LytR/AlgR family response regulator